MGKPSRQRLVDRFRIVGGLRNAEPPILIFARQAIFEDDHGGDDVRATQVRHVVALHAKRCIIHPQGFLDIGQRLRSRHEVTASTRLVEDERVARVGRHGER